MSDDIAIQDGSLVFRGETLRLPTHRFIREIGRGANGIVLLAQNIRLNRPEALKIWLSLRAGDHRDKFEQGIQEAQKAVASAGRYVVNLYADGVISDKYFFVTMEFIKGETLAAHIPKLRDSASRSNLGVQYANALMEAAKAGVLHGDPHVKNVIVPTYEIGSYEISYGPKIKLLDFGTSRFTSKGNFAKRHWRVLERTLSKILGWKRNHKWYSRPSSSDPIQRTGEYCSIAGSTYWSDYADDNENPDLEF